MRIILPLILVSTWLIPCVALSDDSKHIRPPQIQDKKHLEKRHWGDENLQPAKTVSNLKKSVLPDAFVALDNRTQKIALVQPLDHTKGIPIKDFSNAREAAERYLKANHELFGIDKNLSDLHFERELTMGTDTHLTYQQLYDGLPVFGGEVQVTVRTNTMSFGGVNVHVIPIVERSKIKKLSDPTPAIQAVISEVNSKFPSKEDDYFKPTAKYGVLAKNGIPFGAWKVVYPTADGSGWFAFVDGATNDVLSVRDTTLRE